MEKGATVADQRRFKRFDLKLPVELIRTGSKRISRSGETKNMSSGGVLFLLGSRMEVGEPIEYFITLPTGSTSGEDVRLHCMGKVLRTESPGTEPEEEEEQLTAVAATVERYEFVRHRLERSEAPA